MNKKTRLSLSDSCQRGYTLVNVMLLLASLAVIATLQFRDQAFKYDTQKAVIAGQQMRMLDDGIEGYLAAHASYLAGMADNDCSGAAGCTPTTWYCQPVGASADQCDLNFDRLVVEGFLPPNWRNMNAWGSPYKTLVTRVLKPNAVTQGNPIDYNVRAITVTQTPWRDASGNALLGLLGQAVKAGGADMAMTSIVPNKAEGLVRRAYNATLTGGTLVSWSADNSMNPWINGLGQLVARAGFESNANNAFSDLLKRDGSRAMRNNFNMGEQRVNNTQDAFVKKISGGRNLSAVSPTWVFKYSWRVNYDGATIQKPDCRVESGGWTARTTLNNPWDPTFSPGGAEKSYDNGQPRILVVNDSLNNLKALGYYEGGGSCTDPGTGLGVNSESAPNTTSCPANDPFAAYDPALRARARAAYSFYATDGGSYWNVYMRYYQDNTTNTALNPANAQGIASVYCYYDGKAASGCNGESGCVNSGASLGAGSAAAADLSAQPVASTTRAYQSPQTSGATGELPPGVGAPGAADVNVSF